MSDSAVLRIPPSVVQRGETEVLGYILVAAFAIGVNAEIKGLFPGAIGAPVESALRWLPGFALTAVMLVFHRAWVGASVSPSYLIFLLAVLQSCVLSREPSRSGIEFLREIPVYATVSAILVGAIDEDRFWRSFAAALTLFSVVSIWVAVVAPTHGWMNHEWGPSEWRLQGISPQAVTFAFMAGLAAQICISIALADRSWRAAWLGAAALNSAAFWAAGSRGPWLGLVLAVGLTLALAGARPFRLARGAVFVVAGVGLPLAIVAVYAVTHSLDVNKVIAFAFATGNDRMLTFVERALIWDVGRADIAEKPWLGEGYKIGLTVDHYLSDEDGYYPSFHSFFLDYWQGSGIFAMVSLAVMTFGGYLRSLAASVDGGPPAMRDLRAGVLLFILGCALFDAPFQPAAIILGGLAAFAFSVRRS